MEKLPTGPRGLPTDEEKNRISLSGRWLKPAKKRPAARSAASSAPDQQKIKPPESALFNHFNATSEQRDLGLKFGDINCADAVTVDERALVGEQEILFFSSPVGLAQKLPTDDKIKVTDRDR